MVSAPVNVYTARTANKPAKIRVYLGPEDGSADEFTESFDLIPIEVSISAGASPDYAVFEWKTDRLVQVVDATETVTGNRDEVSFNRQVYITVEQPEANLLDPNFAIKRTLFWGELLTETLRIDPQSQRITIAARVAPYHFGDLLEGEYHLHAFALDSELVHVDPVFNPLIDGIVEGNRAAILDADPDVVADNAGFQLWVDPDAVRTTVAQQELFNVQNSGTGYIVGKQWKLNEAVNVIASRLADETFIRPPEVPIDLTDVFQSIWDDQPEIRNLRLQRGRHLNELLDQLLIPHGYGWFLDHSSFDPDTPAISKPEMICFRRGDGVKRTVKFQATGEDLDLAKTTASHIEVQTDTANLANTLFGYGSLEVKEFTIELSRGWPEADDALDAEDLRKSEETSEYNVSHKRTPWRLWVGNEAGDYTGTRLAVAPIIEILQLDGAGDLENAVPTRRSIDECLTLDAQGKRRPPYLEWSDDGGSTWSEVPPEWGWTILPDQIGILFTGDTPPDDLVAAGDDAKVRITGSVTGDERINSSRSSLVDSPSLRSVPLFLDLSDRFHKRTVQTTGTLASVLAGDSNGADEADDLDALGDYLDDLLQTEISAEMRSAFRLHGIHTDYEISDLIISVDGRDVFLNRNAYDSTAEAKYPQIYGIRWLFQEQVTELITEAVG